MKVISVTGGVGSGKSEVLRVLREQFGAEIIIADQIAHRLMNPGERAYQCVVAAFGASFLHPDGSIDRAKMADLMFQDKKMLGTVNSIVHPIVWEEIWTQIAHSDKKLAVVEAALFDDENNTRFDEIWYVYADKDRRISRLMEHRGYSREKCLGIIANQASEEEYRRLADRVIDNNGTVESVRKQIEMILKEV